MMVVSTISTGAGSVAVSARPNFPPTLRTSGVLAITRSCHASTRFTSVRLVVGMNTGMKSRLPSLSGGMNSPPMPANALCTRGQPSSFVSTARGRPTASASAETSSSAARARTVLRRRSAQSSTGS